MVEHTSSPNEAPKAAPLQFSQRQMLNTFVMTGIILTAFTWSVSGEFGAYIPFIAGVTGFVVGMVRQDRAVILTSIGVGLVALFPVLNTYSPGNCKR